MDKPYILILDNSSRPKAKRPRLDMVHPTLVMAGQCHAWTRCKVYHDAPGMVYFLASFASLSRIAAFINPLTVSPLTVAARLSWSYSDICMSRGTRFILAALYFTLAAYCFSLYVISVTPPHGLYHIPRKTYT